MGKDWSDAFYTAFYEAVALAKLMQCVSEAPVDGDVVVRIGEVLEAKIENMGEGIELLEREEKTK